MVFCLDLTCVDVKVNQRGRCEARVMRGKMDLVGADCDITFVGRLVDERRTGPAFLIKGIPMEVHIPSAVRWAGDVR